MMFNKGQITIIKKDIRSITANKNLFWVMLIVPLFMAVVIPAVFVLIIGLAPEDSADFQELLALLQSVDINEPGFNLREALLSLVLNEFILIFFLMIPVMAATITAASSFVGEKEKRTLETLLYCPLTLGQTFNAKIAASFLLSQFISLLSFFVMTVVVQLIIWLTMGTLLLPGLSWLVLMALISPALSLIAISMIVRGSAKAKSVEESYQKSVFLVLPLFVLLGGQFTGTVSLGIGFLIGLGIACAIIGVVMLRRSSANFHYERLLL
ncbi:MAG: ABC transporter permease subunit [Lachnospiraceae bacterium]|nr:ABC transporter permease subunit [Lachnospiraceae bacterium]